jgi:UDP-N-acetylglucosamine acyltransferase
MAAGNPAVPRSINAEGLKRRGFSAEAVTAVKRAYKTLYRNGLKLDEARASIEAEAVAVPELAMLTGFLADSGRGIIR